MRKGLVLLLSQMLFVCTFASAEGIDRDRYVQSIRKIGIEDEDFYRRNVRIPRRIKNVESAMTLFTKIEIAANRFFEKPRPDYVGLPDYNALGFVSEKGDLWFSGIQAGKRTGSVYLKEGTWEKYNSVFENLPDMDKIFFHRDRWIDLFKEGKAVCAEIDGKTVPLYESAAVLPDAADFSEVGRIYNGKTWWESAIRIDFSGGVYARDLGLLCYDVFAKEKEVYILPGTMGYTTFGKSMMPANTTDREGRIYAGFYFFKPETFAECSEGNVLILDAEEDLLYQIRHEIPHRRNALAAHYVLGEDGNIYFQVTTEDMYYIYRIEPYWGKRMQKAEYEPLFLELYPDLREAVGP
jgi:hypothetical protein